MKHNNWKKRIITLLIFVLGGVLFSLNNNVYAETEVSNFNDLKNNLESGISVILEKDIDVTSTVTIQQDSTVTIELNGHNLKCSPEASDVGSSTGAMINTTNAQVTINNKSESEAGFINNGNDNCRAIYNYGTKGNLVIDNVKFDGFNVMNENNGGFGAAIYYRSNGNNQNKNLLYLKILNSKFMNNQSLNGGALYLVPGYYTSDYIVENSIFESNIAGATNKEDGAGGAIRIGGEYDTSLGKVILKGNQINNNNTIYLKEDIFYPEDNIAHYAGCGAGIFSIGANVDLIDNTIQSNIAQKDGGGIAFISYTNARTLVLTNNTINGNKAVRGGGIFFSPGVNSETLIINSGIFRNNTATDDGGAINYTQGHGGTLKLKNALITGNKAVVGGGIWLCPTGLLETYSTLGGAIYNNKAIGSFDRNGKVVAARGNEIRYSVEDADDALSNVYQVATNYVTISPRNHEGKIVDWYADEAAHRYRAGDSPVNISDYKNRTTEFSLTRNDNDYFEGADVIFINNTAGMRGGAIATNWTLIIGEPEDMDITVNKAFVKEGQPYNDPNKIADNLKIYINLYRIDANGKRFLLDKNVELNKGNNFTYTFTDLPTKYNDEEGNLQTYSYEVKEIDEKNQVSNTCTSLNSEKRTCTITNEYVAPPVEFVPSVEKKVTGKTKPKKDASFTFEISSEEQDGVELPKNTKVTVKGEGRVNFGNIKITKAGEYNFTIKEVLGNNLDYKYDLSVWMVKVVVGENVEKGTLYIDSIKYYKKNKEYEEVVFENEYNPSTGDPLLSNVSNFIISGFVILGISMIKRKIYN